MPFHIVDNCGDIALQLLIDNMNKSLWTQILFYFLDSLQPSYILSWLWLLLHKYIHKLFRMSSYLKNSKTTSFA